MLRHQFALRTRNSPSVRGSLELRAVSPRTESALTVCGLFHIFSLYQCIFVGKKQALDHSTLPPLVGCLRCARRHKRFVEGNLLLAQICKASCAWSICSDLDRTNDATFYAVWCILHVFLKIYTSFYQMFKQSEARTCTTTNILKRKSLGLPCTVRPKLSATTR